MKKILDHTKQPGETTKVKRVRKNQAKLSHGVSIRQHSSGAREVQVQFSHQGRTHKEVLSYLDADDRDDLEYANDFLNAIKQKIREGLFVYSDFFPESPFGLTDRSQRKMLINHDNYACIEKLFRDPYLHQIVKQKLLSPRRLIEIVTEKE